MSSAELFQKTESNDPRHLRGIKYRSVLVLLLIALAVAASQLRDFEISYTALTIVLVIASIHNLLTYAWIRWGKGLEYRPYSSAVVDFFLITVASHYVGGLEATVSWIYAVGIIAYASIHGLRMGLYVALISSLMNSFLLWSEFNGSIDHISFGFLNPIYLHENKLFLSIRLIADSFMFFMMAIMSGLISERLIQSNKTLEEQNEQLNEEIAGRKQVEEALQKHRDELEDLITERTSELAKTVKELEKEIADRKQAEEALRDSEERYRTVVEEAKDIICSVDMKTGLIIGANIYGANSLGYEHEEVVNNLTFIELIHPEDHERLFARLQELANEQTREPSFPARLKRADETYMDVEINGSVVYDAEGRPNTFIGVIRDVTERKQAEEALRTSEEKYRHLVENVSDVIYSVSADGVIQYISSAVQSCTGFAPSEIMGQTLDKFTYPDDVPRLMESFHKVLFGQQNILEYRILTKDGDVRWIRASSLPRFEGGKVVGSQGVFSDITEKRQLEEQLFQSQKMESIGTLAGGIEHDFNNLLGGILGYASLMKSQLGKDHQFYRYVDTIENTSKRAADLTSQLLGFARGGKYHIKPLDINRIVGETIKIIDRTLDKSIQIENQPGRNLPTVEADASQIQQVLLNLFVNAADAMPDGGKLTIETALETLTAEYARTHLGARPGEYVVTSVSDTGIGIDKETQERIFEPFFTTKEEGKGTGLGLAMVYGIVKNHDGYVSVYSEPGHGTTFKIYLPTSEKEEDVESLDEEAPLGNGELIMVVDDEEYIRSFMEDVLAANGYRILLAEDGKVAVDLFKEHNHNINLVILDLVMPKMAGREAFLEMKSENPDLKVLLATGYSEKGKAKEMLDNGVIGFLQKPCQPNTLLSKVRSVLDTES